MSAYLIAATGTEVGKTFTTCALTHATAGKAYKPVISGFSGEDTDTHQLIDAMGGGNIEEVSPWRFAAPLSPDMAAARENRDIDLTELAEWCAVRAEGPGPVFIETVGGVMVPLNHRHTTLDWMRALNLPVILVAGTYLGTISHTLTAIAALRGAGLAIPALVLSESELSPVPLAELAATIHNHAALPLIVPQPRVSSWRAASAIHQLARELR